MRKLTEMIGFIRSKKDPMRKVLILDDRENLYRCINDVPGYNGLGLTLNKSDSDFRQYLYSFFEGKEIMHWVCGCPNVLEKQGLQPCQVNVPVEPLTFKSKNAADIKLTVDCLSYAALSEVTDVVILSSDSDFTPLIERLNTLGICTHMVKFTPYTTRALALTAAKIIDIHPFLESLQHGMETTAKPQEIKMPVTIPTQVKHQLNRLVRQYLDNDNKINLAYAGKILGHECRPTNWYGFGNCKRMVLNVIDNSMVKGDYLIVNN